MNNKNCSIIGFLFLYFISIAALHAEAVSAEIININHDQKIIFVDLGRDVLSIGDVMNVDGADHPIYLEVLETSDAVSKLRISKNEKYYSNVSEFDGVTVGMKVIRIFAAGDHGHQPSLVSAGPAPVPVALPLPVKNMPAIDPQAFVKPDLSKESIQSIVDRMDKMVDVNLKLSNTLSQCQADLGESQKMVAANEDLKKQINDLNAQYTAALLDRDKYKKQADDLLAKISSLKARLDHLDSIIGGH